MTKMSALPQKRTLIDDRRMSAKCQKRTSAVKKKDCLAAVSPKIHQCFDALKLARHAASTL
jgi:hypothetical protein